MGLTIFFIQREFNKLNIKNIQPCRYIEGVSDEQNANIANIHYTFLNSNIGDIKLPPAQPYVAIFELVRLFDHIE